MNKEDIMKAMDICAGDGMECVDCPLLLLPGCMNKLILEARDLILSMIKPVTNGEAKQEPWTRKRVLSEAEKCVCGQREHEYGVPEDSFEMIGKLWTVYLDYATKIDAHDVAAMMALLKIARIAKSPDHMDNWCDLAGYAACGGEIAGKEAQK